MNALMKHMRLGRRSLLFAGLAYLAVPALAQCRRTPADALGPFYVPMSGLQPDLCQRDRGPGVVVSGRISGFPECRPIAGALVEVWHADQYGDYSRIGDSRFDDLACLRRGNVRSGEGGTYSFRTVAPGTNFGRPKHIHFRVSAPGFRTLVTQMYFAPQEGIEPALVAKPAKSSANAATAFEFDIALAPL
jgi:protocatechuate 3,4-dioxygenase beta subunit